MRSPSGSKLFLRAACSALVFTAACAPVSDSPEAAQEDVTEAASSALQFSGVSFKTVLGNRYVGAQNNGGGAVTATATSAQTWEKFTLDDINGGSLQSGDSVFISAGNGQYLQAANGGGSSLSAASTNRQGWETFRIVKQSGSGTIVNGDVVGLQTVTTGHWVSAANGGGGTVYAYGGALGDWEKLTISGLSGGTTPPSTTGCDAAGLVWKTANKTNYTSYPDPGSEECTQYNGCTWAGQFAACSSKKSEAWVSAHNIAAVFPNMNAYKLHDLCLKSGSKTIVVTVLDTCADSDCSGCCTQNKGSADALIDLESYTNARWGVPDGRIQWADLGPTKGSGCN